MWRSVSSYFTNPISANFDDESSVESDESDWVFVSSSGEEVLQKDICARDVKVEESASDKRKSRSSTVSPAPYVGISNRASTPQISPAASPSRMDGSWFITPPPCFTVKCPSEIQKSPLEDLLIEHPSMSVYCGFQNPLNPHSVSAGECLLHHPLQEQFPLQQQVGDASKENKDNSSDPSLASVGRHIPDLTCFLSSGKFLHSQQILEPQQQYKVCDASLKKEFKFKPINILSSLENYAMPAYHEKLCVFDKSKVLMSQKQQLAKKDNKKMTKPCQLAQHICEQVKLRSSYINRQNRVQQIRNRHCQRNSHVVKPFGDKCRHHF